jgi:hypothetical protein
MDRVDMSNVVTSLAKVFVAERTLVEDCSVLFLVNPSSTSSLKQSFTNFALEAFIRIVQVHMS